MTERKKGGGIDLGEQYYVVDVPVGYAVTFLPKLVVSGRSAVCKERCSFVGAMEPCLF